jgi:replicative DNA helicase
MNKQAFIVIYGRPKSMKTWIALKMAVHAYVEARRRVLFYSREMPPEEVLERVACILAKVDYTEFINGRLQPELAQRAFLMLHELADDERMVGSQGAVMPYFIVVSDREASDGGGVSWLSAKIEEYKPDVVFADGMYLMKDDRTKSRTIDWKNITHISQDMKHMARRFEIPIVGITQANRSAEKAKGEDLTELSYSDAIGQDADAVFRTSATRLVDPNTKKTYASLLITAPGLRKGVFHGMILRAEPGHTFELMKTLTGEDRVNDGSYQETKQSPLSGDRPPPRLNKPSPFLRAGVLRDPKLPSRG